MIFFCLGSCSPNTYTYDGQFEIKGQKLNSQWWRRKSTQTPIKWPGSRRVREFPHLIGIGVALVKAFGGTSSSWAFCTQSPPHPPPAARQPCRSFPLSSPSLLASLPPPPAAETAPLSGFSDIAASRGDRRWPALGDVGVCIGVTVFFNFVFSCHTFPVNDIWTPQNSSRFTFSRVSYFRKKINSILKRQYHHQQKF